LIVDIYVVYHITNLWATTVKIRYNVSCIRVTRTRESPPPLTFGPQPHYSMELKFRK